MDTVDRKPESQFRSAVRASKSSITVSAPEFFDCRGSAQGRPFSAGAYVGLAIPKFRDPGRFSNPEIPGLRSSESRDFGIAAICVHVHR
jgi:hypothetical protein